MRNDEGVKKSMKYRSNFEISWKKANQCEQGDKFEKTDACILHTKDTINTSTTK